MSDRSTLYFPKKPVNIGNPSSPLSVENQGKQNIREQLKAGYVANAARDLEMAADWFPLEEAVSSTFN